MDVKRLNEKDKDVCGDRNMSEASFRKGQQAPSMEVATRYPPHNAMRHSFATYHVALKRDFHDTSLIMSHRGTSILFKHYRVGQQKKRQKNF